MTFWKTIVLKSIKKNHFHKLDIPYRWGGLVAFERMADIVLLCHVAEVAQVKVVTVHTLPANTHDALLLTRVTDNVWVLHTCKIQDVIQKLTNCEWNGSQTNPRIWMNPNELRNGNKLMKRLIVTLTYCKPSSYLHAVIISKLSQITRFYEFRKHFMDVKY